MIDIILKIVQMNMITNIVAGIILFFILKIFFQWIREMLSIRRVHKANKKTMSMLKPYAAGGKFPAQETIYAVMEAVANEHHVEYKDMHSITYYFQEFIKEILESEYIPSDRKIEYTDNLYKQIAAFEEVSIDRESLRESEELESKRSTFYRNSQLNLCTLLSGSLVALTGYVSGSYNLLESLILFVVVAFALIIFVDQGILKKRYREIPKFLVSIYHKLEHYFVERKKKKEELKRENEQDQFKQAQIDLEEQLRKLALSQNQLLEAEKALIEKQEKLEAEYKNLNDEKNKLAEEQKRIDDEKNMEKNMEKKEEKMTEQIA